MSPQDDALVVETSVETSHHHNIYFDSKYDQFIFYIFFFDMYVYPYC